MKTVHPTSTNTYTDSDWAAVAENAGKQNPSIALDNALMVLDRLAEDCYDCELYAIYYSLMHLRDYIVAAQKQNKNN